MDEPTGQEKSKQASKQPDVIPPATIPTIEQKLDDQTCTTPADKSTKQNAYIKKKPWLKQLLSVHADRQVELILAFAITFFALCQVIVMCSGSSQTDKLITAANRQESSARQIAEASKRNATAAEGFATNAGLIDNEIEKAVGKLDAQARASQKSANAAKSAAATANEALHVSERAYVILGIPVDDFPHGRTDIPIINSGHIPSGITKIIAHEATFRLDDPSEKIIPLTNVLERHWREADYQTIPVVPTGNLESVEVDLPGVVQDQIINGKEAIMIAAVVTYNDGFPNTPEQTYLFCDTSSYIPSTKLFLMRPCASNSNLVLQSLLSLDKYPSPEYQEK